MCYKVSRLSTVKTQTRFILHYYTACDYEKIELRLSGGEVCTMILKSKSIDDLLCAIGNIRCSFKASCGVFSYMTLI